MAEADVIVVGAGPAGCAAARAAAEAGLSVLLLDRTAREIPPGMAARFGREVWLVGPGFSVTTTGPDGTEAWAAPALILATGATDRLLPFPGWTLPGVVELRAAAAGSKPVVAGLARDAVEAASRLIAGGVQPAAVAIAEPRSAVGDVLEAAGVPVHYDHVVVAAAGTASVAAVVLADAAGHRLTVPADSLHIAYGRVPASEAARALGAPHVLQPGRFLVPVLDDWQQSMPGLFVAGDAAGAAGDEQAAIWQGELAGLGAARHAGHASDGRAAALRAALAARPEPAVPPDRLFDGIAGDIVVCRCEGITAAEIDEALDEGASEIEQLKLWTHCGMGMCQGRLCSEVLERRLQARTGAVARGLRARPPLRPVPVAALIGPELGAPLNLPIKRG